MKMGTTASPWRYDAAAHHALQPANLPRPAMFAFASWAADQPSGSARCTQTRTFMFDLDLHWCERGGSRRHGLLGRREHVACGRRTRYVLRTLDSKVHPSCINGLKHFFGRSGVALRDAELLERFRPPCRSE